MRLMTLDAAGVRNGLVMARWMARRTPLAPGPLPRGLSRKMSSTTGAPLNAASRPRIGVSPVHKNSNTSLRLASSGGGGVPGVRNFSLWPFGRAATSTTPAEGSEEPASTTAQTATTPLNNNTDPATTTPVSPQSEIASQTATPATTPATTTTADTTTTPTPATDGVTPAIASDSGLTEAVIADASALPDTMGYLSHLGLDFGYGPSSLVQWMLESIHVYTGLSWVASIVALAVGMRVMLFPVTMGATDTNARISRVRPQLDLLRQKQMLASGRQDRKTMWIAKAEMKEVYRKHGIKTWKSILPMVQVPIGIGSYRVMEAMSSLGIPSLEREHFLWITDVTAADPFYVLPLMTSTFMYLAMKRGGETGGVSYDQNPAGKIAMVAFPAVSAIFTAFCPGMLQVYFCTTSIFALGQSHIFASRDFRHWANITQVPDSSVTESTGPGAPAQIGSGSGKRKGPPLRVYNPRAQEEQQRQLQQHGQTQKQTPQSVYSPATLSQRLKKHITHLMSGLPRDVQKQWNDYVTGASKKEKREDGTVAPQPRLSEKALLQAREVEAAWRDADFRAREARNEQRKREWQEKRAREKRKEYRF